MSNAKKKSTKEKFKKLNLHGYTIKYNSDKICISLKNKGIKKEEYSDIAQRLATYMHDEMFITDGNYDIYMEMDE